MSTSAAAKIAVSLKVFETLTGLFGGSLLADFAEAIELANGTTDGSACDLVYAETKTGIAASSTTSYDLAGSLLDKNGATITFKEVCLIALRNKRTTAQAVLTVGPHGTNGFGALTGGKGFWQAAVNAGGGNVVGVAGTAGPGNSGASWFILYDWTGVPVTAATADILAIVASAIAGDTNSWDIVIIGRSA
jgi:hypothetical protein